MCDASHKAVGHKIVLTRHSACLLRNVHEHACSKFGACACSVYQALFPSPALEPGYEARSALNRTPPFDSGSIGCQVLHGLGCNRTLRFALGSFMALGAIEGNRSHLFDLGSAGC